MNKIELEIRGITQSQASLDAFVLIVGDLHSKLCLPIVIGNAEAQSIAVALEGVESSRPMTHDLLENMLDAYSIDVEEVIITDFREGIYFATIICRRGDEFTSFDARPSDAIALAVRWGCPFSAYEKVMNEAGLEMDEVEEEKEENAKEPSLEELQDALEEAIDAEDYQKAAMLRDEIIQRGGEIQ